MRELPFWIRVLLIKDEIEEYIHAHPAILVVEFFIHRWEDLPIWRTAAAQVSLATGKRISFIFPPGVIIEQQREETRCKESTLRTNGKETRSELPPCSQIPCDASP